MRGYTVTPRVAPVCGGIDLFIEGIDVVLLEKQQISVLVAIEGSRQRHICSTVPDFNSSRSVICAVPEHEPAEDCALSLVFFGRVNDTIEIIPIGKLHYQTDQTQLLAVYLAKSVHDVESLEDWDEIRGPGFSLCAEDFATLDERLCAAFHHLLLPDGWSLLGDNKDQMARETLFHFCARLGLVKFIRLLFNKPGAKLCLNVPNRHEQLPYQLADSRQYDELHRILCDPNAIKHYKTDPLTTHELDHGACLRYTDHRTVNVDIDVSDPESKSPLSSDVLLFKEPLHSTEELFSYERSATLLAGNGDVPHEMSSPEPTQFFHTGDQPRRVSQISLHLSDSRPTSADPVKSASTSMVKMRQRHSSDDFDVMPDVKRRSIIAQHLSDSLNSGERRHSWHESEQSLLDLVESSSGQLQRSRSYEHIDEPELSGDEDNDSSTRPIEATQEEIIQIENVLAETRRKNSHDDRRRAIVIKESKDKTTLSPEPEFVKEKRLMDERKQELPKKLVASSKGTTKKAMRESFLNFFPGRKEEKRVRKGTSPRKMPLIQSDTDTDSENRKYSSIERNESNSSADDRGLIRVESMKKSNAGSGTDCSGVSDFEQDQELNTIEEPETWGHFVQEQGYSSDLDSKKERARQENIYELMHTERNHSKVLRIMQKIFLGRMRKELGYSPTKCEQFFPQLKELSLISHEFIRRMTERQKEESPNISYFGDVLYDFWNSDWGERKARAYAELCKKQFESLKLYREEIKNNKKFSNLIQKYKTHPLAKRYEIPDCTQLATQRLTKYPIMIKEMLKNADDSNEKENLTKALDLIQKIILCVNGEVQQYEKRNQLNEIVGNIDPSSFTLYNDRKFKRKNLTQYDRALLESYDVQFKLRDKAIDANLLVMEDIMILLTSKGNLTSFITGVPVLSLRNAGVREKPKDSSSLFISHPGPVDSILWEIRASSADKAIKIKNSIAKAQRLAPKYTPEARAKLEEDYRQMKNKAGNIISQITHTDIIIRDRIMDKHRKQKDLFSLYHPSLSEVFDDFDANQEINIKDVVKLQKENIDDFLAVLPKSEDLDKAASRLKAQFATTHSQLRVGNANIENHLMSQSAELLKYKHTSGFRRSDGVLESEDKKYTAKKAAAIKELEAEKKKYADKMKELDKHKIELDQQYSNMLEDKSALDEEKRDLQSSWKDYQRQLEVLRAAQTSQSTEAYPSLSSTSSGSSIRNPTDVMNQRRRTRTERPVEPAKRPTKTETIPIHLAHSAVNESANPRNSMRQNPPLFALAESSKSSPMSGVSKLASSSSKSRLKTK